MRAAILALALLGTGLTGCFDQPKPACAFLCSDTGGCPDDYTCAADGWCKLSSISPEPTCDQLPPDATPPADSGPDADDTDGGPDASGLLPTGDTCSDPGQCQTGNCSNGRCCDTPCAGACDVCSVAQGATANGTCTLRSSSFVCRAASGVCDVAETCTGGSGACPADAVADTDTVCDATTSGDCDIPDTCDGSTKSCPEEFAPLDDPGNPDCGNYSCPGDGPDCATDCTDNTTCDSGFTCDGSMMCT